MTDLPTKEEESWDAVGRTQLAMALADPRQRNHVFVSAARGGRASDVAALISADPDLIERKGWLAAFDAAHTGRLGVMQVLLDHGLDPKTSAPTGVTILDAAIRSGHQDIADLLASRGARPSDRADVLARLETHAEDGSPEGAAFLDAAMRGDAIEVRRALARNPTFVAQVLRGSQQSALHLAAAYGHVEVVKELLTSGADVNAQTALEQTPMVDARGSGFRDIWELLSARGGMELP